MLALSGVLAAGFTVTTTADDGSPGSLRGVISQANANGTDDTITLPAGHHAGQPDQVLSRRADAGRLSLGVGLFLQAVVRLENAGTSEMGGVPDLYLSVVDPQIDRPGDAACDDYTAKTGEAKLRPPVAADI